MILIFSQVQDLAFCAVCKEHAAVANNFWNPKKTRDLLGQIFQVLQSGKVQVKKISKIALCPGPGNFTPARISCLIANTFSQTLNIPLFTFEKELVEQISEKNFPEKLEKILQERNLQKVELAKPIFAHRLQLG